MYIYELNKLTRVYLNNLLPFIGIYTYKGPYIKHNNTYIEPVVRFLENILGETQSDYYSYY